MREQAIVTGMTPFEAKQTEQGKIAPVLGAVAALPAAGLVYAAPSGAPLFAAALVCAAAGYAFWILVDAYYYQQLMADRCRLGRLMRPACERLALAMYWPMIAYVIAAVALTLAGFAGSHGAVRMPVSLGAGFAASAALAVAVGAHVAWAMRLRQIVLVRLVRLCRRAGRVEPPATPPSG